jgi:hypothetical protein
VILRGVKLVSMQWLSHSYLAPQRMICRLAGVKFCEEETYSRDGISNWVYGPYQVAQWFLGQHVVFLTILSIPVIVVAMSLHVMESVSNSMLIAIPVAATWHCVVDGQRQRQA